MTGPSERRRPSQAFRSDADATVILPAVSDNEATAVFPLIDSALPTQSFASLNASLPTEEIPRLGEEPASTESVARSSGIMALGSLVSRATGFIRTAAIGAAIGGALVGNAYQVANTLPNMLYELLLGGILSSVVVPLLVTAMTRDKDGGEAFTHRLLTAATLLLGGATVLALLAAPLLTLFFADAATTSASRSLTTTLAYLLLPEIFFYGIAALLAAVLNAHKRFGAPMWAPILNNITVIVTAVVFMLVPGPKGALVPENITGAQVAVLGVGTTLGIVLQASALWPSLRKIGFRWKWRFDLRGSGLGEAGRLGAWMFLYVGISQLGLLPVIKIANYAGDHHAAGPTVHNNAYLLFMMVHGIVAVSILTALLPRMSKAAAENRLDEVTRNLSLGARLSSVVLVPATVAYVVLGVPLAVTAFQWGAYAHSTAVSTGYATMAAAVGLVPFAISQMQIFVFYALRDTKTPALLNIPIVVAKIVFDLCVFFFVPTEYIVVGLQFGNTVSYVVAVVVTGRVLKPRLGSLDTMAVTRTITRLGIAAVIGGLVAWAVSAGLQSGLGHEKLGSLAALVIGGVVLIGVYAVVALRLRVAEVVELAGTVRRRLPGR